MVDSMTVSSSRSTLASTFASDPAPLLQQALHLSQAGDQQEAIASFDRVIATMPDCGDAWYGKGVSLYQLRRYERQGDGAI
jgi:Flp pilus assembly protein TadD